MEPIRRRLLLSVACAAGLLRAPFAAPAAPKRVVLVDSPENFESEIRAAVRQRLAQHGFLPGRDYLFELVNLGVSGDAEIDRIAREVVASHPDVIVVGSAFRTEAFRKATRDIPVVFFAMSDPVSAGFVQSLSRPARNMTGASSRSVELITKEAEMLMELVPRRRCIALLSKDVHKGREAALQAVALAMRGPEPAKIRDVNLPWDASPTEVVRAVVASGADAVIMRYGVAEPGKELFALLARHRIASAVVYYDVRFGGLLALGEPVLDMVNRAFDIVARVLRGEAPATIPVDEIARIRIALNLRTARMIGVTVPPALLARADEVIT
jgi:putative ABC transport system substrate-binding protein